MQKIIVNTPSGIGKLVSPLIHSDGTVQAIVHFEGNSHPGDWMHKVEVRIAFDLDLVILPDGERLSEIEMSELLDHG